MGFGIIRNPNILGLYISVTDGTSDIMVGHNTGRVFALYCNLHLLCGVSSYRYAIATKTLLCGCCRISEIRINDETKAKLGLVESDLIWDWEERSQAGVGSKIMDGTS